MRNHDALIQRQCIIFYLFFLDPGVGVTGEDDTGREVGTGDG